MLSHSSHYITHKRISDLQPEVENLIIFYSNPNKNYVGMHNKVATAIFIPKNYPSKNQKSSKDYLKSSFEKTEKKSVRKKATKHTHKMMLFLFVGNERN
jgi:hypothetical protein